MPELAHLAPGQGDRLLERVLGLGVAAEHGARQPERGLEVRADQVLEPGGTDIHDNYDVAIGPPGCRA